LIRSPVFKALAHEQFKDEKAIGRDERGVKKEDKYQHRTLSVMSRKLNALVAENEKNPT